MSKKLPPKMPGYEETPQDRGIPQNNASGEAENAKPLRSGFYRWPAALKSSLIKFWFAGAVCFFFVWGILGMSYDGLDTIVAAGAALGAMTDIIVNRILAAMDNEMRPMGNYLMFNGGRKNAGWSRKTVFFFLNVAYGIFIAFLISVTYGAINIIIVHAKGLPSDTVSFGVEPLLYGVFYIIYDFILLGIRYLVLAAVRKLKAKGEN